MYRHACEAVAGDSRIAKSILGIGASQIQGLMTAKFNFCPVLY